MTQKNQLFVGHLSQKEGSQGNIFFSGYFGGVPIVGFLGKQDPDKIHIVLDVERINYKRENGTDNQDSQVPQTRASTATPARKK
ncbi:MAG: hypothetical protein ABSH12_06155 [Endomicrobiales bacterium]|jgi:hypothetical protein